VSHAVQPDQYAQAAQEALSKLTPEGRAAFVKMLQERAAARGVKLPGPVAPDPKDLGQVLTDLHKKPGQLRDMLGAPAQQPLINMKTYTALRTRRVARATLYQRSAMRDILLLHGRWWESRLHLSRGCGCATSTPFYLEGRGVGRVCLAAGARHGAGASENPVNETCCGATAT